MTKLRKKLQETWIILVGVPTFIALGWCMDAVDAPPTQSFWVAVAAVFVFIAVLAIAKVRQDHRNTGVLLRAERRLVDFEREE